MQCVAEATAFVDSVNGVASGDLLFDPVDEPGSRELLSQRDNAAVALSGDDDVVDVHIQDELEGMAHCGLVSPSAGFKVGSVMKGWSDFVFHITACARLLTRYNPSWHLTRRGRRGCNRCLPCAGSLSWGR